jgi:hypothetical protein
MRLNRRGRIVRALLIGGVSIALYWLISTQIWWTEGGYCLGSMAKCYA